MAESRVRANMLARTMTQWSYQEGSMTNFKDAGFERGEWMATLDEATGEWDEALDGTIVALGGSFVSAGQSFETSSGANLVCPLEVQHPPLHPNCRCVILPV